MDELILRSMLARRTIWVACILLLGCVAGCSAADEVVCEPSSSGVLGANLTVYNRTLLTASMFRNDADKIYYKVWPEDISNPRFQFFCQDGSTKTFLNNFTISCDQRFGKLDPRPYYDVGIANDLQPYYKHWTYAEIIPTTDIQIWCERRDMRRLYSHRIWRKTLLPAVLTTIVLLIILEGTTVAVLCISAWRRAQLRKHFQKEGWAHEFVSRYLGGHDTIADCLNILLLVMAGFCVIEAVSHSSTTSWRSTCMLDSAVLYTYLTLFAVLSSFARQLATACRETARDMKADAAKQEMEMQHASSERHSMASGRVLASDDDAHAHAASTPIIPRSLSTASRGKRDDDEDEEYGKEGNDWRWQRVFNQFAVVILMTAFLSYNENFAGNALDSLVSVIWAVIMVAATWSIGVSIVFGARAVLSLARHAQCCPPRRRAATSSAP